MVAYTTAQIDAIVMKLESGLGQGFVTLREANGAEVQYRSVDAIRNAISYFQGLYPVATDAPTATATPKVRTFFYYGSKGFGW